MGRSTQDHQRIIGCALAGALLLGMTGCQSLRLAGGPGSARAMKASGLASREVKEKWQVPWKRESTPDAAYEVELNDEESGTEIVSTAPLRPVARLGMPVGSRRSKDVVAVRPEVASVSASRLPTVAEARLAGTLPSATDLPMVEPAVETGLSEPMRERMEAIFLTSATLPGEGDSIPSNLDLDFSSAVLDDVAEQPLGLEGDEQPVQPEPLPTVLDDSPMIHEEIGVPYEGETVYAGTQVIREPLAAGAGPDYKGLWDNLISRLGANFYENRINSEWGFLATGESTHQWFGTDWFTHGGVSSSHFDNHTAYGGSVGFSRLARIVGKKVEQPWILGFAYDGMYDDGLFGTANSVYVDQMRGLLGYALFPRWDIGVWAAGGISEDSLTFANTTAFGPAGRYKIGVADRVAGYTAYHFFQTGIFHITSFGYQDVQDGNFFVESDMYIPLTGAVNLFVGGGYSDAYNGSSDFNVGLEFTWGRTWVARGLARHFKGKTLPKVGMLASDTMPKRSFVREIDPTCVRYRGGWANDTYRSALRMETPARLIRRVDFELVPQGTPTTVGVPVVPPPVIVGEPTPEEECPPPTNPLEERPMRWTDRPVRESRLSQLEDAQGRRQGDLPGCVECSTGTK